MFVKIVLSFSSYLKAFLKLFGHALLKKLIVFGMRTYHFILY